jgi:hypothetical protein
MFWLKDTMSTTWMPGVQDAHDRLIRGNRTRHYWKEAEVKLYLLTQKIGE